MSGWPILVNWQPARISSKEYILQFHSCDPGEVSKWGGASLFAGEIIRVRESVEAKIALGEAHRSCLHCDAETWVEVHPEDALRLWPECAGNAVGLCEHQVQMD